MSDHGEYLKSARIFMGLTQVDLARRVGVKDSYIARIEKGRQRGSFEILSKIAEVLELPPELVLQKAGLANIGFVEWNGGIFDLETHQFSKLDPKLKNLLLELAPLLAKFL